MSSERRGALMSRIAFRSLKLEIVQNMRLLLRVNEYDIKLPQPIRAGGLPLMEALNLARWSGSY